MTNETRRPAIEIGNKKPEDETVGADRGINLFMDSTRRFTCFLLRGGVLSISRPPCQTGLGRAGFCLPWQPRAAHLSR